MIKIAKNQFRWTVTLNRPNKANAINIEMLEQLNSVMDAAKKENSLRSIIFTGAGKVRCFRLVLIFLTLGIIMK